MPDGCASREEAPPVRPRRSRAPASGGFSRRAGLRLGVGGRIAPLPRNSPVPRSIRTGRTFRGTSRADRRRTINEHPTAPPTGIALAAYRSVLYRFRTPLPGTRRRRRISPLSRSTRDASGCFPSFRGQGTSKRIQQTTSLEIPVFAVPFFGTRPASGRDARFGRTYNSEGPRKNHNKPTRRLTFEPFRNRPELCFLGFEPWIPSFES